LLLSIMITRSTACIAYITAALLFCSGTNSMDVDKHSLQLLDLEADGTLLLTNFKLWTGI
jgi:hypothetical protein